MVYNPSDIFTICTVGASEQNSSTSVLSAQCIGSASDDPTLESEAEQYQADVFGALGVTSMPYPKDDTGYAEAYVDTTRGNVIAMRDTRVASIVGQMDPGDTVIHSTGPNQAARIFLKEDSGTVAIMGKNNGADFGLILDGATGKIQTVSADGSVSEAGGASQTIAAGGKAWITVNEDGVQIVGGKITLGVSGQYVVINSATLLQILTAFAGALDPTALGPAALVAATNVILTLPTTNSVFSS